MKGAVTGLTSEAFWAANSLDPVYKSTETDFKIHMPWPKKIILWRFRSGTGDEQCRLGSSKKQQPANPTATKRCYKSLENFLKKTQTFAWKKHQGPNLEIPRFRINSLKNLSVSGVWQSFSCSNPCPQSVQEFNQPNHSCGSLSLPVERIRKLF